MFSEAAGCVVTTPIKAPDQEGSPAEEWSQIYIRGFVDVESEKAVANCATYLVEVTKRSPTGVFVPTHYIDDLQLPWSNIGVKEITIPSGVRRFFDIISIDERHGIPRIARSWPLTLRGLFDEPN